MPGPNSENSTLSAKLFQPIYRLFPVIGIDATELARVMIDVGMNQHKSIIFENSDMRAYGLGF